MTIFSLNQQSIYKCIFSVFIVPEPTISILRVPEHPLVLFTTDSLVLNCVIELIPEVDSYIAISSKWSGHSSLTDSARVIVADLEGGQLTYNTSFTFKSSDSGSYNYVFSHY